MPISDSTADARKIRRSAFAAWREPFAIVAAPLVAKRIARRRSPAPLTEALIAEPHLAYDRIRAGEILGLARELPNVVATFNDIASTRSACLSGLGWALLPAYTVRDEVRRRELVALDADMGSAERFGVFWLRSRPAVASAVRHALRWLGEVSLSLEA